MFDSYGVFPKAFEVIKTSLALIENVNDHVNVIYERPLCAVISMIGSFVAGLPNKVANMVGNRLDLHMRLRFAYNKKVCNGFLYLSKVEGDNCSPFFVLNRCNDRREKATASSQSVLRSFTTLKRCDYFLQMKAVGLVDNIFTLKIKESWLTE